MKNKHTHYGHRQRLKEKARVGGLAHWPNHEVLELWLTYAIPRKDVNPIAHHLLDHFESFASVFDASYDELKNFSGLGEESALFIKLFKEIMRRYQVSKSTDLEVLNTPKKCADYFRGKYELKQVEEFYLLCLDAKRRLISSHILGCGLASTVDVPLGSVAAKITSAGAKAFVIIHNHPGGDENPTEQDVMATKRFMDMSITIGVQMDDHIIVTEDTFFSFHSDDIYTKLYNISKHSFQQSKNDVAIASRLMQDIKKQN